MNKILLIIQREYLTRVKKKSFIIMTLLTPVLIGAMIIIPVWMMNNTGTAEKKIAVVTTTGDPIDRIIPDTRFLRFDYLGGMDVKTIKRDFGSLGYFGVLILSEQMATVPGSVQLISFKQPPLEVVMHIENSIEEELERQKLESYNISNLSEILKAVETKINLQTIKISEKGEEKKSSTGITMGLAYLSGFLIYFFTFMFGAQVMRGVIEEKTSRIVEVIISSVKPFQLMMGKILGIALVGLTQFIIWVILTGAILTVVQSTVMPENLRKDLAGQGIMSAVPVQQGMGQSVTELTEAQKFLEAINSVAWLEILGAFIIYFLGGYLLYASLFAAVGSAVDNETDTQQFMLPITIPLILGLFVMLNAFQSPDSQMAFWFSLIPLTSPIVMMARIPFGVPLPEVLLSMTLLVLTFIFTTWLSGRIYRTGILMYGKKSSYRELWKWIWYRG